LFLSIKRKNLLKLNKLSLACGDKSPQV